MIGHILSGNGFLKQVTVRQKGGEEEEEDVSSYWKTKKK